MIYAVLGYAVASLALIAWLTYQLVSASKHEVAATKDAAKREISAEKFESALELAHFEIDTTRNALKAAEARCTTLDNIIAEVMNANEGNADLAPGDWKSRELRIAREWAAADANRVHPDPKSALSAATTDAEAEADLSSPTGVDGV